MEQPKKISKLHKWYLKYTNRQAYDDYKLALRNHTTQKDKQADDEKYRTASLNIAHPSLEHPYKQDTFFKHSGNSGDIIYSLPTVYELAKNGHAHMLLYPYQKLENQEHFHPLGDVMLNTKMMELLEPLLLHQPEIKSVGRYVDQQVDYDLDLFRKYTFRLDKVPIARWYYYVFAVFPDLCKPWLTAPKDDSYADYIVIARSHRYRAPTVDYGFLKNYSKKIFVGVPVEYEDIKKKIPNLEYQPVKDFLELATIINSCRFFIGNQSFPFSIAEGLKVNRILECYFAAPNVMVQGYGGHDFFYQAQFEKIVADVYEKTVAGKAGNTGIIHA